MSKRHRFDDKNQNESWIIFLYCLEVFSLRLKYYFAPNERLLVLWIIWATFPYVLSCCSMEIHLRIDEESVLKSSYMVKSQYILNFGYHGLKSMKFLKHMMHLLISGYNYGCYIDIYACLFLHSTFL